MVKGSMKAIKFILGFVNLIIACFSIAFIALGVNLKFNLVSMDNVDLNIPSNTAIYMIILGCALFVVSFLGCYGAFAESYCMLTTYGVVIFVFLFLQLVIAGLLIAYRDNILSTMINQLKEELSSYDRKNPEDAHNQLIDTIQKTIICCGVENPNDWSKNTSTSRYLPDSCCYETELEGTGSTSFCANPNLKYYATTGCATKVTSFIKRQSILLGSICISFILIQVISIIFAYCLCCSIRSNYDSI